MGRGLLPAPSCTLGGGGGGMAAPVPGASPYRELDARAGPRRGPLLPGRCRAAPAGRGWLMVSGQWLAGCGAAGSSRAWRPRTPSRGWRRIPARRAVPWGGRGSGGPSPPPVPAVWAFTCAAACVGAGAAAAAGCAGGSASGRGRYAEPGGASCWRPHP